MKRLALIILGLCRNISAGKSCRTTSHKKSHEVFTTSWRELHRELQTESDVDEEIRNNEKICISNYI